MKSISVVIVTYNSSKVLAACLESIPVHAQVLVVDNSSDDGTRQIAARLGAKIICNETNLGFGCACNLGAEQASGSYILFLNPDASLGPESLEKLEQAALRYPDAAAFGPNITSPTGIEPFRFVNYVVEQGRRKTVDGDIPAGDCCVGFINGAAFFCRRDIFLKLGGFDKNIFLYFEDDDLCFRLQRNGYPMIYVPSSTVLHRKGRSTRRSLRGEYSRAWHQVRSRMYVCDKYGLRQNLSELRRKALLRSTRAVLTLNFAKALRHLAAFRAMTVP